jgi:hypothetical protein
MNAELRWRFVSLQIVMVVVLAFTAGFLYWAANFTHSYVQDELTAQKINFPAASSPAISALPAANATAMKQYAGQALDDGDKAKVYANNFIAVHLSDIGMTYSQASAKAMANPKNTQLAGTVQTLFRGETLRGLLLNAWGWWTVGTYALYAAIGLTVAAVAVLGALVYELFVAPQQAKQGVVPRGARVGQATA